MDRIYQQGDVILVKREKLPPKTKKLACKGRWVIAEGEQSGHAHVLVETEKVEMREDANGVIWVKVNDPATLTHEEHKTQTIAPGVYETRHVLEIDPFSEEIGKVRD